LVYNTNTLFRKGNYFVIGNESFRFPELRNSFKESPLGLDLYLKAKKSRTSSLVFRLLSLSAGMAALGVISESGNRNTAYYLLGSQLLLGITGSTLNKRSWKFLDQAIWFRNKDVLFPAR